MRKLLGITLTLAIVSIAAAQVWDNNIETDGFNGRAISPPLFPNIRVADDIVVGAAGLTIGSIRYSGIEDSEYIWEEGDPIVFSVYTDADGRPGSIFVQHTVPGTKTKTGNTYFGRDEYIYCAEWEDDPIRIAQGHYWVGVRHPTGRGWGTVYWMTSDGGPDGAGTSTGYVSMTGDAGPWLPEGSGWQHAFVLNEGSCDCGSCGCDPCDANCDGSVDLTDVAPFIKLLFGEKGCDDCTGDTNEDGSVDLTDVEDFIDCLLG